MQGINIVLFLNDYLATAAWATCESGECTDFTSEARQRALADCTQFISLVKARFGEEKGRELLTIQGNDLGYQAPHDFFLTRCGHGAGFWDKEDVYGVEAAAILTEISKEMGNVDVMHIDEDEESELTFL